jgi:hypothetical protein
MKLLLRKVMRAAAGADIAALAAAVDRTEGERDDQLPVLMLADALEEAGLPQVAKHLRRLVDDGRSPLPYYSSNKKVVPWDWFCAVANLSEEEEHCALDRYTELFDPSTGPELGGAGLRDQFRQPVYDCFDTPSSAYLTLATALAYAEERGWAEPKGDKNRGRGEPAERPRG